MPRRRVIAKRTSRRIRCPEPARDEVHQYVMTDGQAQHGGAHLLQEASTSSRKKTSDDPLKVFKRRSTTSSPAEVKSRRVGGSNYQVPVEVNPTAASRSASAGSSATATSRGDGKTMQEKLANKLMTPPICARGREGNARHASDAEANKAFAHYRW